jgi:hypothetical protein
MNSEVFFEKEQAKWKGKKGLYVIECPLFSSPCAGKPNEESVYKVGYTYQSLTVRIADCRTHYGKIQFKIHLIWEVPNPPGYRVNFALQTEQRIHKTLHDLKKSTGVKTKEWFYDLPVIKDVILSVRNEYMNGTKGVNNTYNPIPVCENKLGGWLDSDFASDIDSRKSVTGYLMSLNGGPIFWKSSRQGVVTLSNSEAEFVAASQAGQEVVYLRTLLRGFGYTHRGPTEIWEDNALCIMMSENPTNRDRSRHVDVKVHFLRDLVRDGHVKLLKCEGTAKRFRRPDEKLAQTSI